jgi:N-methylhydantoinase B
MVKKPGENDFRPMHGFRTPLPADTEVFMRTGGGGGWGDPLEREIDRVQNDVREGFVSHEAAARLYGVVVREDFSVDAAATMAKRAAIKAERNPIERGAVNSALV